MMQITRQDVFMLIAEDDEDDRFLFQSAYKENGFDETLHFVENGIELIEFLHALKSEGMGAGLPRLIVLDINMPKKDGKEVLMELKMDPVLCHIPITIFSTTCNEHEMTKCYEMGADAYITKPDSFDKLLMVTNDLRNRAIMQGSVAINDQ